MVIARAPATDDDGTFGTKSFPDLGLDRSPPDLSGVALMPLQPPRLSDVIPSSVPYVDLLLFFRVVSCVSVSALITVPISKRLPRGRKKKG